MTSEPRAEAVATSKFAVPRRRPDIAEWKEGNIFPRRETKELTYKLTGTWEKFFDAVLKSSEAVELSPQNAYIRRLQHQMAERANLVSRSRGREPFRRVRLYPDAARSTWR